MSLSENTIVLCVDEKSQVQAIDRRQALLLMEPSRPERHAYDFARHGTTSLFAALNVAAGHVIGAYHQRHRQQEFVKLLDQIDLSIPETMGETIRNVMDNYAAYKIPKV